MIISAHKFSFDENSAHESFFINQALFHLHQEALSTNEHTDALMSAHKRSFISAQTLFRQRTNTHSSAHKHSIIGAQTLFRQRTNALSSAHKRFFFSAQTLFHQRTSALSSARRHSFISAQTQELNHIASEDSMDSIQVLSAPQNMVRLFPIWTCKKYLDKECVVSILLKETKHTLECFELQCDARKGLHVVIPNQNHLHKRPVSTQYLTSLPTRVRTPVLIIY